MDNNNEELEQYDYWFEDKFYDKAIKKYGEVLGQFFMEFSALEHELNIAIADIISECSHDAGYQIMEQMNIRNKIDLFYRLYNALESHTDKRGKEKLKDIKNSLNSVNTFRNLLAHANWQTIKKDGTVSTRFSSDKESGLIKFKNIVVKPKDIRIKIKETKRLTNKIWNYKEKTLGF